MAPPVISTGMATGSPTCILSIDRMEVQKFEDLYYPESHIESLADSKSAKTPHESDSKYKQVQSEVEGSTTILPAGEHAAESEVTVISPGTEHPELRTLGKRQIGDAQA